MSQRITAAAIVSFLAILAGCEEKTPERSDASGTCQTGQAQCSCYADDTCVQGLVCVEGTCRDAQGDPSSAGDGAGGDPSSGDPSSGDPSSGDPSSGDPSSGDPSSGDPGPHACGGIAGTACPPTQHCFFDDGKCGMADLLGTCLDVPDVCSDVQDPVCGCDGHTYNNRCQAQMALAQVDHLGECK